MNAQATVATITRPRLRNWRWFVLALIALAITFMPFPTGTGVPWSRDVRIDASQYEFSPAVISVNQGDRVTIELNSTDVVHGLYLDGYGLEVTADPGQIATLSFIADKSGTFRFRCSVTCGPLHPFMIGKLNVGNNTLLWRGIGLAVLVVLVGLWKVRV
jgi:heme/copper-type cytochrome/quinol oxidase subunit 2